MANLKHHPDSPAKLTRIDLVDGAPSRTMVIADGPVRAMVEIAILSAKDDLWRFVVETRRGVTLLPAEVIRLYDAWIGRSSTGAVRTGDTAGRIRAGAAAM